MTESEAKELLGLSGAACALTPAIIQRAYRQALVKHHPDTRIALDDAPVVLPKQLQAAAEILRRVVAGEDRRCKTCSGRGVIQAKMGTTPCAACKGTGDKRNGH